MKKTLAILLLAIHCFNIYGYRIVFSLFENTSDEQMTVALDNNQYDENNLMQLKFALNMPYMSSDKDYERCDGQVEYNGIQYNYVKRMVKNDTLYLYCIPNKQKTAISNIKTLYAQQNAENTPDNKAGQPALKLIRFALEYSTVIPEYNFGLYNTTTNKAIVFNNCTILKGFTQTLLQPPNLFI